MIVELANAKINLFLNVCARRADGFHDIESVMQSVSLCDEIILDADISDKNEINITTDGADLPSDRGNLVYRAAEKYLDTAKLSAKVDIRVKKNIPIAAGLAGGSSDAAATLRALNRVFGAFTADELSAIAATIGSDVPFCLIGGTAICKGRGEKIQRLQTVKSHAVIAIGIDRVSTPEAYARLDCIYSNFDGSVPTDADQYFDSLLCAMKDGVYPSKLYNIFETDIDDILKSVIKIKAEMRSCGSKLVLMSGSGPSVFALFSDAESADNAAVHLQNIGYDAYSVTLCE